jgi:hypothetical protein
MQPFGPATLAIASTSLLGASLPLTGVLGRAVSADTRPVAVWLSASEMDGGKGPVGLCITPEAVAASE